MTFDCLSGGFEPKTDALDITRDLGFASDPLFVEEDVGLLLKRTL